MGFKGYNPIVDDGTTREGITAPDSSDTFDTDGADIDVTPFGAFSFSGVPITGLRVSIDCVLPKICSCRLLNV